MRMSDVSSAVCSADLEIIGGDRQIVERPHLCRRLDAEPLALLVEDVLGDRLRGPIAAVMLAVARRRARVVAAVPVRDSIVVREWIAVHVDRGRSEEHTSELQSLMRISYAVFCLKKKKKKHRTAVQQPDQLVNN